MISKLLLIMGGGLFIACGPSKKLAKENVLNSESIVHPRGLEVIKMNDCYTCHSISNKLVGPAFTAIANKYEFNQENIDRLSKKIISGGGGVWRDVPMTPHPALKDTDAKEAVKYILSLKK
jgi:cytochrome c